MSKTSLSDLVRERKLDLIRLCSPPEWASWGSRADVARWTISFIANAASAGFKIASGSGDPLEPIGSQFSAPPCVDMKALIDKYWKPVNMALFGEMLNPPTIELPNLFIEIANEVAFLCSQTKSE